MVRHLVLPGSRHDSIELVRELAKRFSSEDILLSVMSQFTPVSREGKPPRPARRVTTFEYDSVLKEIEAAGFEGYRQERDSAEEEYIPEFYDRLYYPLPESIK